MQQKLIQNNKIKYKEYKRGSYNKFNNKEQWIRISEGCPNNCDFCRETKECGIKPIYLKIPKIVRNRVKIIDMNLMYKDYVFDIIKSLGSKKVDNKVVTYELVCGIDWRFMNQDKANLLKENRFNNIRFAWDFGFEHQFKIKDCLNILLNAGYKAEQLSCFMICDWKIPYDICLKKLDLLKIWNVKVNDCWFDNVKPPKYQLNYWTLEECLDFRSKCRKHNQLVNFKIDPEVKNAI